jgi:hypothetical protein
LGNLYGATVKQENQQESGLSRRGHSSCGTVPEVGGQQDNVINAIESRDVGRGSSKGRESFRLWEESETCKYLSPKKAHVYDLVNCGPRSRFVIRNNKGEVFISHNSMGHGIDGLQDGGNLVTWFGLTWSLDLFDQFNARVLRQGQPVPVICNRIVTPDTFDMIQMEALKGKILTQESLKKAVNAYRARKSLTRV